MRKKKILVVDTGNEWGGGTNSLLYLLENLSKTNKYKFLAVFRKNYKKGDASDIKTELEKLGIPLIVIGVIPLPPGIKVLKEIWRVLFFWSSFLKKWFFFLLDYHYKIKPEAKKISQIIRTFNPDLIYLNNQPTTNFSAILAAKEIGIPVILHCRRDEKHNCWIIKTTNQVIKKIICVSEGIKNSLISQGIKKEKCVVVYNGIDCKIAEKSFSNIRKNLGISGKEVVLLSIGRLIKPKRVEDFVKIFKMIKDNYFKINIKGIIVGDGPEKKNLKKLIKKEKMEKEIFFVGFQLNPFPFIYTSDIVVVTSESEGFPRVVLESMLLEKPVIAYNIPGVNEVILHEKTGFLIPFKDYKTFVKKLIVLIQNPDLRKKMGKAGKKRVIENFNLEQYVKGVEKVFEEVFQN